MNTWRKNGDSWAVQCDTEQAPGAVVTVVTRAGKAKTVTLGERQNLLGFVYAVADTRPQAQAVGDLAGVFALFDRAATYMQRPAVVIGVGKPGFDPKTGKPAEVLDFTVRLNIAGERAKVPGSITVLDGERTEEGRDWFGRILRDGSYQPSNATNGRTEAITAALRRFAADPATGAKESARLTGRCCFCNTALKDERSTAVGYGETCAAHFGLPWGERPAERL